MGSPLYIPILILVTPNRGPSSIPVSNFRNCLLHSDAVAMVDSSHSLESPFATEMEEGVLKTASLCLSKRGAGAFVLGRLESSSAKL